MSGRFLTAPLLVSALIVALSDFVLRRWTVLGAGVAILAMINLNTTLLSDSSYANTTLPTNGIADERAFYFKTDGLAFATRVSLAIPSWDKKLGQIKSIKGTCGYLGRFCIENGPQTHVIDLCGLADPLLAHLPVGASADWHIGHFVRDLPAEYPINIL